MSLATVNVLAYTYEWFERAIPKPTERNVHVQLGVHFEEVGEMLTEIHSNNPETANLVAAAQAAMDRLAIHLKTSTHPVISFPNRLATLDSICDQLVTATGVAHMLGMDPVAGLAEVNRSNWSKFVNGEPQFDANGKIMKPKTYSPPDLKLFI